MAQPATDRMNGCFSAYRVLAPTAEPMGRVAAAAVQPKVQVGAVPRQETMAAVCQLVLAGSCVRPSEQHGKTCQCVGCTWEESPRLYSRPRPPLSTTRREVALPRPALHDHRSKPRVTLQSIPVNRSKSTHGGSPRGSDHACPIKCLSVYRGQNDSCTSCTARIIQL